jgi:hypothetical protein
MVYLKTLSIEKKVKFSLEDIWRSEGVVPPFLTSALDRDE